SGRRGLGAGESFRRARAAGAARRAGRIAGRDRLPDEDERGRQGRAARGRRRPPARDAARSLGRLQGRRPGPLEGLPDAAVPRARALVEPERRARVPPGHADLPVPQGMRAHAHSRRAGWTLVELIVAVVLVGAVVAKGAMAMHSALEIAGDETSSMAD